MKIYVSAGGIIFDAQNIGSALLGSKRVFNHKKRIRLLIFFFFGL